MTLDTPSELPDNCLQSAGALNFESCVNSDVKLSLRGKRHGMPLGLPALQRAIKIGLHVTSWTYVMWTHRVGHCEQDDSAGPVSEVCEHSRSVRQGFPRCCSWPLPLSFVTHQHRMDGVEQCMPSFRGMHSEARRRLDIPRLASAHGMVHGTEGVALRRW
jgi:hypothetical protein